MKRRVRKVANFFAFNLLFFALYLNFIHKDKTAIPGGDQTVQPKTAAFSGTMLVDNPDQYLDKKNEATSTVAAQQPASVKTEENQGTALKLSIN
ncbi:MAG: hypothetical protein SGI83_03645 [Bacteroidota bacterium]|nr:hypothetical protein [Bacteroidota bacterium]